MIRFGAYRLDRAQGLWRDEKRSGSLRSLCHSCGCWPSAAGEVISKEELFRLVWMGTAVSDSALTSCIQELRRALGDDAQRPQFIETLHRRGYRFRMADLPGSSSPFQPRPAGAATARRIH